MSNITAEKKLVQVFALWKRKSKGGKKVYFSGKADDGTFENEFNLTAFYNTEKKNLKEPDLRVYVRDDEGELSNEPWCSLWCNATKNGKKILSGKVDGKKVIGFINANATEKQPYICVYWSNEEEPKEEKKPKGEKKTTTKKTTGDNFEEIPIDETLPF